MSAGSHTLKIIFIKKRKIIINLHAFDHLNFINIIYIYIIFDTVSTDQSLKQYIIQLMAAINS